MAASMARRVAGRPAEIGTLTPGKRTEFRIGTTGRSTGRFRVSDIVAFPAGPQTRRTGHLRCRFQIRASCPGRFAAPAGPAGGDFAAPERRTCAADSRAGGPAEEAPEMFVRPKAPVPKSDRRIIDSSDHRKAERIGED